jgi:beta-galactosidase
MQMDVCDSLGMMVMAESFDSWIYPKCKNGYSRFFKEWAEKDLTNLLLGHRNHPCIIMWSIGNEIPEQTDPVVGVEWSKKLQDLCHKLDPTRPVTQGLDRVDASIKSKVASTMDVVGLNYRTHRYQYAYDKTPQKFILGTETGSTVSSRGVYKIPYKTSNYAHYEDGQCSSYDNEWCSWSNLPDVDFENMEDLPWTIAQFVWTGIDYLGEPTPYDEYWPSRTSYLGICDLAGLPKDRYYLYRSVWNKEKHTLHIAPHWTWGKENIGRTIPVQVYTDYEEAELFVNGKSKGRIKKNHFINCDESGNQITGQNQTNPNGDGRWDTRYDTSVAPNLDRFRLRWFVKYEPGELKVVAYDKDGEAAEEQIVRTADYESQLLLEPDVKTIKADGDDLCYITVSMLDKDGNFCADSDDEVLVTIEGAARFKAICNGDPTSVELFTEPHMRLFKGKLVITIQSTETPGDIKVTVIRPSGNYKDSRGKKFSQQLIENSVTIKSVK